MREPISKKSEALNLAALVLAASMIYAAGCGFTGASPISPNPPSPVTVTVSPQSATVMLGGTAQFAATVTGASSTAVSWSVNGTAGGSAATGKISDAGLYTAPSSMPAVTIVTVTATSVSDSRASASATVQLQSGITVSIAPGAANVAPSGTQNFTTTVSGGANSAVSWSVNGISGGDATNGTLSATGPDTATYTAPAVPPASAVTVVATSVVDPSKSASASVTVSCPSANSVAPSSATVIAGGTQLFTASLCVSPGTPIAWAVNGISGGSPLTGTILPGGANTATYTAPPNAPANPLTIEAIARTQSATATVTVISPPVITVNVSPASASLAPGARASFSASVGGTLNTAVTWNVNGIPNGNSVLGQVCAPNSNPCAAPSGSETSIDYLAPQIPPQPTTVILTATSVADTTKTGSAQIIITTPPQPGITLVPFYVFLAPLQQFHFIANISGESNTGVVWTVASAVTGQGCVGAACGSIDNAGNYIAPPLAPSPNAIQITATSAANPALTETATVAITSGPAIETALPSSVVAGAQQSFALALKGLNFAATTATVSSQILVNSSPRATNCSTPNQCAVSLQPSDLASPGVLSLQIQNPGAPGALSNPISLIVLPAPAPASAISLSSALPVAAGADIIVPEATTAGATTSPVTADFIGMVSPDGSTCAIQASPIEVTRPVSGTETVNVCVQGNFLDPTFTYGFSAPSTGGDIGISTASMSGLFPNLIELTLTISSQTAAGLRTLSITTPNGDIAVATGILEVK